MNQRKKGVILSYVYMVVTIITTFLYTPFLISNLGQSEYGLYTLVASVISYLSLLDLGLGNSMIRYISKYKTLKDKKSESEINGMFLILYVFISILSVIIGIILFKNINNIFGNSLTLSELKTFRILFIILIINVAISFPLSVFGSYVMASEKFFFQKVLLIIKTILMPVIMIPLLLNGYKSIALVIVLTILTLLLNLANLFLSIFKLDMKFIISKKCFSYLKEILAYSFFIFLAMIVDSIFNHTDQVLLGIFSGSVAVSIYGISSQIRSLFDQLSTSISGVFLPKIISMKEAGKTKKEISDVFIKISRIQILILFLILTGFIIFGKQFITIWTNKNYIDAYFISIIIMIPSVIPLTQNIAISVIQAENKHQFRSIVYLIIAIMNILISIPLIKLYSGIGAAIGTSLALFLGQILIMNIYYYKVIKLDIPKYWKNIVSIFIPISIYSVTSYFIIKSLNINNWISLIINISIYSIGYFVLVYIFFMNKYEKSFVKKAIKYLKTKIHKIVYNLWPRFLIRKIIILESGPDMSDSTYEIYKYMLKKNVNKTYKLVWFVTNPNEFNHIKIKNVKFVQHNSKKIIKKIIEKYYNYSAKLIIDGNKFVYKKNKHQIRYHVFHGLGFKNVPDYTNICGDCDYFISTNDYISKYMSKEYKNPLNKFLNLGLSRNDVLVKKTSKNIKKIFNLNEEAKVIVWLPTYRSHKDINSPYHQKNNFKMGIPVINDKDELIHINNILKKNKIYIVLKPHPAEDLKYIKSLDVSNLIFLDDNELNKNNITLYELLSKSDSLLTDYSSVYIDYLLTGKIIGITLDDYEEYNRTNGFTCENYEEEVDGEKIYNIKDFEKYIKKVATNDYDKKKYEKITNRFHKFKDANSTKRLYEKIEKDLF